MKLRDLFVRISQRIAEAAGHPGVFITAVLLIILWAASGPIFGFSDTWQLIVNTSTTIITFLMVFLIQSTQNRDSEAIHLKIDELIRATEGAHLALMDIEKFDEDEFQAFRRMYDQIAKDAKDKLNRGENDINCPELQVADLCFPADYLQHHKNDKI